MQSNSHLLRLLVIFFFTCLMGDYSQAKPSSSASGWKKELLPSATEIYLAKEKSKILHILINGGMHGNERLSPEFIVWLKKRINEGNSSLSKLKFDFSIDFLPISNTQGYKNNNRYNSNGVNLNRNFPVLWGVSRENPGTAPGSEVETKLIMKLFNERKYDVAIDIHGYVDWIVGPTPPSLIELHTGKKVGNVKKNKYNSWVKSIKTNINFLPKYRFHSAGGLGDGGSFEDYAFWQMNVLTFCLEISESAKNPSTRNRHFVTYEAFIKSMLQKAFVMKTSKIMVAR